MRVLTIAALCALLAGCGVSKELYEREVVRSQDLAAREADLRARLDAEAQQREAAESELAECRAAESEFAAEGKRTAARVADLETRLNACAEREGRLRADLDVSQKAQNVAQADAAAARRAFLEEQEAHRSDLEACRGEGANLDARIAVLLQERELLEREKREKLEEVSKTYEGFLEGMKEEIEKGRVTISKLRGKLSVNLLDEILFDSGSATLKGQGREVLKSLGEVLRGVEDKAIVIEGHTDNVPIATERFPTNWELSTARATSVVRYLQEQVGIDPKRLSAVGFGPYRPVASNDTPEGRAKNRRIEVKVVPLEAPVFGRPGGETGEAAPEEGTPESSE